MENEWIQWSKYVLKSLERNEVDHEKILAELHVLSQDVVALKVKMFLIGVIAGSVPAIVITLLSVYL